MTQIRKIEDERGVRPDLDGRSHNRGAYAIRPYESDVRLASARGARSAAADVPGPTGLSGNDPVEHLLAVLFLAGPALPKREDARHEKGPNEGP